MNSMQRTRLTLVSSLALLLALSGCNRAADGGANQRADSGIGKTQRAEPFRNGANDAANPAAENTNADASKAMGAAAGEKVDDAAITAKVNASLARDKDLSASKIDVDTQNGVVTLSGPTPSATAKQRAAEIAHQVKGVISVNNQLTITSG